MIRPEQISDKCIIAAATAYDDAVRLGVTHERAFAHALAAALNAWPDGGVVSEQYSKHNPRIILPLPKEGE
jgi:hypothetical protein